MTASKRTPEMAEILVEGLSNGRPLRQLCRENDISFGNCYEWFREDKELGARITRAREAGADAIAEEAFDIMDDGRNDWMQRQEAREGQPEGWTFNAEHVQRSKLRVEGRLKLLAKWFPSKYGERITHAGDPNAPLSTKVTHDLTGLSAEQLRAIASIQLKEQE